MPHPSRLLAFVLLLTIAMASPGVLAFASSSASSLASSSAQGTPMAGCHSPHPSAPAPTQDQHLCCANSHQRAIVVAREVVAAPTVAALLHTFDDVVRILNVRFSSTADFSDSPPPIFSLRI
jgi:hypothetical protein